MKTTWRGDDRDYMKRGLCGERITRREDYTKRGLHGEKTI